MGDYPNCGLSKIRQLDAITCPLSPRLENVATQHFENKNPAQIVAHLVLLMITCVTFLPGTAVWSVELKLSKTRWNCKTSCGFLDTLRTNSFPNENESKKSLVQFLISRVHKTVLQALSDSAEA